MNTIVGIAAAVIIAIALGFGGWLYLGRDPMSFAGGSTVRWRSWRCRRRT